MFFRRPVVDDQILTLTRAPERRVRVQLLRNRRTEVSKEGFDNHQAAFSSFNNLITLASRAFLSGVLQRASVGRVWPRLFDLAGDANAD
jgi:hypothetical protein